MEVYNGLDQVPSDFGPSVVTIGKFDGVHLGHEKVIERLRADALAESLTSTVVTFDRNPLSVLAPQKCPPELVSNTQKLELLSNSGVAATVVLEFTKAFSENSPREFVEGMLVNILHAKIVLVGADFRFGHFGAGDVAMLREFADELGFRVELLDTFDLPYSTGDPSATDLAAGPQSHATDKPRRRVSSTWVRELLWAGAVRQAGQLLGRNPIIRSRVTAVALMDDKPEFPAIVLAAEVEGIIPAVGVYATWAVVDGNRYPAITSIGDDPTLAAAQQRQVKVHLLAESGAPSELELEGKAIEVHFVDQARDVLSHVGADELSAQIEHDIARARVLLSTKSIAAEVGQVDAARPTTAAL